MASSSWFIAPLSLDVERLDAFRLAVGAERNLLDSRLGALEQPVAMGLEQFAALIEGDRFLQRDGAAFELFDDRLELGERLLERQSFDVRMCVAQDPTFSQASDLFSTAGDALVARGPAPGAFCRGQAIPATPTAVIEVMIKYPFNICSNK